MIQEMANGSSESERQKKEVYSGNLYHFPKLIWAMVGRRCCAAGFDGRAAARPYRLEYVPSFSVSVFD